MTSVKCPDCGITRDWTHLQMVHVMKNTGGRCVICYDKFCGWIMDIYDKMSGEEREDFDKIPLPNPDKVKEFLKKIEQKYGEV